MNSAQFECPDCAERPSAADYVEQRDLAIAKTAECEKLKAEVVRLKTVPMKYRRMAFNAQLQDENTMLKAEHDELAAQVEKMREALSDARLSLYGTPYHLTCVDEALALPDISTSILNRVRADALRKAAEMMASSDDDEIDESSNDAIDFLRALAADMEAGK